MPYRATITLALDYVKVLFVLDCSASLIFRLENQSARHDYYGNL